MVVSSGSTGSSTGSGRSVVVVSGSVVSGSSTMVSGSVVVGSG
jgi:hypothetical protein